MNLRVGRNKQEFEEVSVGGAVSEEAKPTPAPGIKREGFLRSRREKRKEKKAKKKKDGSQDNTSNKDEKSDIKEKEDGQKSKTPTPEVDEEGYCIRPKLDPWDHEKGSFYSSSDTDSEDEREQKIHVEIKPLGNGTGPISASVDELRATVENISLSPLGTATGRRGSNAEDHTMKRSQSVSQQIGGGKLNNDLVGLNLFQSPVGSSASTPTGSHPYAPLQSPTLTSANSPAPVNNNRYSDLQDLFQEVGVIQPSTVDTKQRQTPTIEQHHHHGYQSPAVYHCSKSHTLESRSNQKKLQV
ncbi:F-BAR domain only protein 2-like [Homalodisca vitripennis]|uniref:F-BAR domain only protein 2-like n=1 Tax=Homalodisca vitripennis TaxID=197043 RepID=UPI001EEAE9C7|nr:F-BAR domain only protein 2-like [Homalodisca vitripennis]